MPRPKLKPTDEQRRLVKQLAATGTPHEEIACMVNIHSPKTLRKHFREELDRGATEANFKVAGALFNNAMSGDTNAQKFWLQTHAGWGRSNFERPSIQPPPFIVVRETEGGHS
jgi:hypothetical protein